MTRLAMMMVCATVLVWLPDPAAAQASSTFRWQLAPFCNVLTLNVTPQGSTYTLSGTDDNCGGTAMPVTGTAFLQGSGVTMGLTVMSGTGGSRTISATLSLATFSGPWTDGNDAGTLTFSPAAVAGQPLGPVESVFARAQVRADGSLRQPSSRVLSVTKPGTGTYCINFTTAPSGARLEAAQVTLGGATPQALFPHINNGQGAGCPVASALKITFHDASGMLTDARFTFLVP